MGNGHFPDGDYTHASYYRLVHYIDDQNEPIDPPPDHVSYVDQIGKVKEGCRLIDDKTQNN